MGFLRSSCSRHNKGEKSYMKTQKNPNVSKIKVAPIKDRINPSGTVDKDDFLKRIEASEAKRIANKATRSAYNKKEADTLKQNEIKRQKRREILADVEVLPSTRSWDTSHIDPRLTVPLKTNKARSVKVVDSQGKERTEVILTGKTVEIITEVRSPRPCATPVTGVRSLTSQPRDITLQQSILTRQEVNRLAIAIPPAKVK